jgi:hypothetical protein
MTFTHANLDVLDGTAFALYLSRTTLRVLKFDVVCFCHRCETEASIPLEHVRRPRDTPIWKLEAALKCRSCRTPRYSPRVHMIKLTQQREIAPYKWVHPDDDR